MNTHCVSRSALNRFSRIGFIIALVCIACACVSCAFDDYSYEQEARDMEYRDSWCRSHPVECLKSDISGLKEALSENERKAGEWEELARIAAAPDCDLGDCAEAYARRSERAESYREVVAQQKKQLREMERKLEQMQRSSDGHDGGGGSSGGGSSH
ncbi:hypothetical protein [Oceanidesulfovibrio indonesiensis]|nr:hypothetical protein [Oceanidesulfovibrio indonesiensis]